MILRTENSKEFTKNLLELLEFSKVSGNQINIQSTISIVFLHISKKKKKSKMKSRIYSMYNSIKRTKCLGTNLTKEVQNLHSENHKTTLREIKPK